MRRKRESGSSLRNVLDFIEKFSTPESSSNECRARVEKQVEKESQAASERWDFSTRAKTLNTNIISGKRVPGLNLA